MPARNGAAGAVGGGLAGDGDGAGGERVHAEQRARGLGAPGAEQAREAHDLAPAHGHVEVAQAAPRGDAARLQQDLAAAGMAARKLGHARGLDVGGRAAEHVGDEAELGGRRDVVRGHGAAVAHHRDAIADGEKLVEEVADVEHGGAVRLEVADDPEQRLDFTLVERGGGLVHDDELGVERDGARDGDELLDGGGKAAELRGHVDVHAEPGEDLARAGVRGGPVDAPPPGPRLVAEHHVLRDGAQRDEVQLLVDGGDARLLGLARARDHDGAAVEDAFALVAGIDAGEDLDQRGLAGAVLADDGVDLAPAQPQARVHQRGHAAEGLADAGHAEQGVGHRRSSQGREGPRPLPSGISRLRRCARRRSRP
jgi:hypothetical protein